MEAYQTTDPMVEITPADRQWAAAALATDDHHADGPAPAECLAEPNPRDSWPEWTDDDVFEPGPDDRTDREWDELARERWELAPGDGWPTDFEPGRDGLG